MAPLQQLRTHLVRSEITEELHVLRRRRENALWLRSRESLPGTRCCSGKHYQCAGGRLMSRHRLKIRLETETWIYEEYEVVE